MNDSARKSVSIRMQQALEGGGAYASIFAISASETSKLAVTV